MTTATFAPTIVIDGRTVQPAGWMWVLGFALAGVKWAMDEAETPEFRARAADGMRAMRNRETEAEIAALEQRLADLRLSLSNGTRQ